jgi:hypothetical protein
MIRRNRVLNCSEHRRKTMKKLLVVVLMTTALTPLVLPGAVQAQMGGPGGRSGMRNNPKMRLGGLMRSIGMLERGGKAPLSAAQAKTVVATINPWRTRPRMNESEAKGLYMKLNAVLTTRQKNELDKRAAQDRRFRGGSNGGSGGGGWSRGGSGGDAPSDAERQQMRQRMQQMQGFFKTYNPFYPPAKYSELKGLPSRMQESYQRRYVSQMAMLTSLAKKAR